VSTIPPKTVPLIGFAPDVPASTPGALLSARNLIPTASGFAGAPEPVAITGELTTSGRWVTGAALVDMQDGSSTARRLWVTSNTFPFPKVSFAQFGIKTVKADGGTVQIADSTNSASVLTDIAGAPRARIVVSAANFVLAFGGDQLPTYTLAQDRWWCCAINDPTSWAPSVTTQATTGMLVDGAGYITAAKRLADSVVVFKGRAVYVGQYVGPPIVWQWQRVPGASGCFGVNAVCDVGGRLLYAGENGIFVFDGSRAEPLGVGVVRDWWLLDIHPKYRECVECVYDPVHMQAWIWYPSRAAEVVVSGPVDVTTAYCDRALVYDFRTQRWGLKTGTPIHTTQQLLTIDSSDGAYMTNGSTTTLITESGPGMNEIQGVFDGSAPTFAQGGRLLGVGGNIVTSDRKLSRLTGQSTGCGFQTWDIGDDDQATQVLSVRLRYAQIPPEGTVTGYTKTVTPNGEQRQAGAGVLRDGKFAARQNARWHHFEFDLVGAAEVSGLRVELATAGRR
jgi:hypothetical protein